MDKALTATERAHRSRQATKAAIGRELMYASILARIWPAHLMPPRQTSDKRFVAILCIETPAGEIVYRLTDEELPVFSHLEERPIHGGDHTAVTKEGILLALATEGWE